MFPIYDLYIYVYIYIYIYSTLSITVNETRAMKNSTMYQVSHVIGEDESNIKDVNVNVDDIDVKDNILQDIRRKHVIGGMCCDSFCLAFYK